MALDDSRAKRWRRVEDLFRGALELPEAEREAYLDAACEGDAELLCEVGELLRSDAEAAAGDFIASAVRAGEDLLTRGEGQTLPLHFGKYEVEGRLGEGGFGVVYRGLDPQLQRPVAIKACTSFDEGLRKRFYREARIAAGLRHPNITTVHELGVEEGVPFLVQELLDGEDLRQIIQEDRRPPLGTKIDVLAQIARGLDHAHRAGVLHRDVKPANVRILPDGTVKLMDFGIAKVLGADTGLTGTGTTLGTVGYLAPEQLRSEEVDEGVDIFAFGVLAYELLAGRRPFRGDDFSQVSYQLLYEEPPRLSEFCPGCPAPLVELVHQCLAKDRVERPGSFGTLGEQLAGLDLSSQESPTAEGSGPLRSPAPLPRVWSRARVWTAAVALVVGLGGLGWLGSRWRVSETDGTSLAPPVSEVVSETGGTPQGPSGGAVSETGGPSQGPSEGPVSEEGGTSFRGNSSRLASETGGTSSADLSVAPETGGTSGTPSVSEVGGTSSSTVSEVGGTSSRGSSVAPTEPVERFAVTTSEALSEPAPSLSRSEPTGARTDFETMSTDFVETAGVDVKSEETTIIEGGEILPTSDLEDEVSGSGRAPAASVAEPDLSESPESRSPSLPERAEPVPAPTESDMRLGDLITTEEPGVEAPRLLERPQPEYPARALRRGIEGQVVVKVLVDETGRVLQAIAPGKDEHGFLAAARHAARGARFEPASRDGIPGRMWINLPFDFTLE